MEKCKNRRNLEGAFAGNRWKAAHHSLLRLMTSRPGAWHHLWCFRACFGKMHCGGFRRQRGECFDGEGILTIQTITWHEKSLNLLLSSSVNGFCWIEEKGFYFCCSFRSWNMSFFISIIYKWVNCTCVIVARLVFEIEDDGDRSYGHGKRQQDPPQPCVCGG